MNREGRNNQGRNPWQYAYHILLCTDPFQALKGERLSSVFSPAGTLISASAAPHCGVVKIKLFEYYNTFSRLISRTIRNKQD